MSYVVSIRRPASAPALQRSDFEALVQVDPTLQFQGGAISWKDPETNIQLFINIEADYLWTDHVIGSTTDSSLSKLRHIAAALDARVVGEEGEDITDDSVGPVKAFGPKQVIVGIAGLLVTVVSLPFLIAWFIIRVPWMLWKITRT